MTEAYLRSWLDEQWARAPQSFEVPVDGTPIACLGWNMEATHLPGLILVHGFRAHAHWWDHIAPALADSHRVVALNMSGMGDSGRRLAYTRAQFAQEILGVAVACGFHPFTLVTHSFGTIGGILAANAAPDRVHRLIMIDAGLPIAGESEHQIPAIPSRLYASREAGMARFRLNPPGVWPVPEILTHIAYHAVCETEGGWTWKFDPALPQGLNHELYRDRLNGIQVSVDIIRGDRSEIMTTERVAEARRLAPHAGQPIVIPASHHHILVEQPLALTVALRALLANGKE